MLLAQPPATILPHLNRPRSIIVSDRAAAFVSDCLLATCWLRYVVLSLTLLAFGLVP